jgi:hypothetical protein
MIFVTMSGEVREPHNNFRNLEIQMPIEPSTVPGPTEPTDCLAEPRVHDRSLGARGPGPCLKA